MRQLWGLTLLFVLTVSPVSADVADFLGKPVTAVTVEAEGRRITEGAVLELLESEVGAPLRMRDVRASVAHLFSLGRFSDVVVYATPSGSGVSIRYQLVSVHPIERMVFTGLVGADGVDQGSLRRAVVERFGATPPASRGDDLRGFVTEFLRSRGYRKAVVAVRVDLEHQAERATLTVTITPGARTVVSRVEINEVPNMADLDVARRLGVTLGSAYQPELLQERGDRFIGELRRRGHFNARLVIAPRFSEDESTVALVVNVVPGPLVQLEFAGDPLPQDRVEELVPLRSEGAADEDLLEDSVQRIQEFFRAQGYRDATATFTREARGDALAIRFTVSRGSQYRVARVEITGNDHVTLAELAPALRVQEGQVFSASALSAEVAAIQDQYARRGYASARAEPIVRPIAGAGDTQQQPVLVRIEITENVRTVVGSVLVYGNDALPSAQLTSGLGLQTGQPFYPTQLVIDQDAIQLQYANAGFRNATVGGAPGLNTDGSRADIVFVVEEGPRVFVDHVLIIGNQRTSADTIRRELQFKSGDPLGLEAVSESQRRLATLGLFRRTRISELGHGGETSRDVLVTVEEAPVTTLGYGGGLETKPVIRGSAAAGGVAAERLEFAPRAFFEIGRRNLFGKNRSINFFTRVSFRPQNFGGQSSSTAAGGYGFSEYRVIGTYREPRVRGSTADAFLTATIEQQRRASFNFARRAFSAEVVRRLTREISATGNYQLQQTRLFDERIVARDRLLVDRLFPQVRLSSFSMSTIRDSRDDLIDPKSGSYLSANGQIAGRHIGSEVGFLKGYFTAQLFQTIPPLRALVFATSLRVGLASGFPRTVVSLDANAQEVTQIARDLPASERFFAGGDTTVRGFALDQLGTVETIGEGGFPIGGNGLVIFNAELRLPLRGGLGLVGFFDTGNVFKRTTSIDLGELRSALGFGIRYRSPVGPIRVDFGIKANRRDLTPGVPEDATAVHISLGQAF